MLATLTKIILLLIVLWIIFALLTGRAPLGAVARVMNNSAKASRSRTMVITWWTLIFAGAIWIVLMAIYH